MAAGTKVQLRLGDRVVAEVAFHGDELRIGEHVLAVSVGGEEDAQAARTGESDAWDAARTYFAPERAPRSRAASIADIGEILFASTGEEDAALVAEAAEAGAASAAPVRAAPHAVRRPATSLDLPDPEGRFAIREEDLVGGQRPDEASILPQFSECDFSGSDSATSVPFASVELAGETTLFDFAASHDLGLSEPSLARALVGGKDAPAQAAEVAGPLYAGLIVVRAGKLERVVPFDGAELVVGRGPTCDLVLSTAGISRHHARFVREAGGVRVLDLDSANGLRVNGERATEHVLQLGDVVAIDDYALTLVFDREPLDQAVRSAAAPSSEGSAGQPTALHSAPFASMPERDLVTESDDEDHFWDLEKELEIVSRVAPTTAGGPSRSAGTDFVVEVVLGSDGVPPALRAVLLELGAQELRLPAELRIRRRS
jgi:predicted component of type VI protein secretion system